MIVDKMVPGTQFETPIENCYITKNLDTGSLQTYIMSAGSLWNIDGAKDKVCVGKVEGNGKLIPSSNAQAGRYTWWRNARYVEISASGRIRIWY